MPAQCAATIWAAQREEASGVPPDVLDDGADGGKPLALARPFPNALCAHRSVFISAPYTRNARHPLTRRGKSREGCCDNHSR